MRSFFTWLLDCGRRNPVLVTSLAFIAVAGPVSLYLWHRQEELTARRDEISSDGAEMQEALISQGIISAQIATINPALDFIDRNLFNEGDLAENLGYFYQIENIAHIRFTRLSQLSSQPGPPDAVYKAVPFTLRASGTYHQMLRLLHELETGPRLLHVKSFVFTASVHDEDLVSMELNVELLAKP